MPATPDDLAVPRRLHPITPALDLVVQIRALVIPLVILAIGGAQGTFGPATIVTVLAVILGIRILRWSRYSYRIEGGDLHIEEGVIQRTRRTVPLSRVQQVDVQRALRHRLAGVAALRIDTAGGTGSAEATLEVISLEEAARLRRVLLAGRHAAPDVPTHPGGPTAAPSEGDPSPPGSAGDRRPPVSAPATGGEDDHDAGEVLLRIPSARLALGGITGARLLAIVVVAGSALQFVDDVPEGTLRTILDWLPGGRTAALLMVVVGLPVWLAVAAGSAVLTDGGFTLTRRGGSVHVRRGVLDQREATVGLHRVQAVRLSQNPVRRALGLVQVQLQSAGSGTTASGDVTRMTIPIVAVDDLDRVLAEILPGAAPLPALAPAPPAARRRAIVRRVAAVALVAGAVAVANGLEPGPWLVTGVLVLAAAGLGELAYRGLGHHATDTHVTARRGSLVRETVVVPIARTQSARLRSSPFQRRAGLATLLVDVAGRGRTPAILDGPAPRLAQLRRAVLLAPGARHDEAAVRRRARRVTA